MIQRIVHLAWLAIAAVTLLVYVFAVPLQGTLLLALGAVHGVLFATWFNLSRFFPAAEK